MGACLSCDNRHAAGNVQCFMNHSGTLHVFILFASARHSTRQEKGTSPATVKRSGRIAVKHIHVRCMRMLQKRSFMTDVVVFFVFCLTIKRLLFIETKPNITSYNLYYVNLRWEKERKERHDSLYSPLDSLQPQRSEKQKTICSSIFHEAQSCRFSAIRLCSTI